MGISNIEPPHYIKRSNAGGQQNQEDHRSQSAEPHNHIMVSSIVHQVMQISVNNKPQSEEIAADLQLAGSILKRTAVVLGQVLQVKSIDAHDYAHGEDVQFEQPEVADNGSSIILEVLFYGALPPIGERSFGVLLTAGTRRLQDIRFAGH